MNKVLLVGRLTADPELRQTQSGVSTCRFNVAVDRKFADKATGERQADFVSCVAWRQTAEFVTKYFNKGSMIGLEGTLHTDKYTDRNHPDVTHYTTDVYVDNVEFVGSKKDNGGSSYTQPAQQTVPQTTPSQQPAQDNSNMSYGSLSEFEEILSDGDVPF